MQLLSVLLAVLLTASVIEAASFGQKIVNGNDADIADYPFAVSVYFYDQRLKHWCGGSILNEKTILTAAHCIIKPKYPQYYRVRYGFTKHSEFSSGEFKNVVSIDIHEHFNRNTELNDIAILKLDEPIKFGPSAQAVKLPSKASSLPVGTLLTAVGWGDPHDGAKTGTDHLKKVQLPLYSDSDCEEADPSIYRRMQFCAGYPQGGKGACEGDSGGPLVFSGVQYGIVSYGTICAAPKSPTVFTRVQYYLDWIKARANVL